MDREEGLAAIAAAAVGAVRAPEESDGGAVSPERPDAGSGPAAAQVKPAEPAKGAEPDLAAVRSEAARAERARLLALDGLNLPGCAGIIAAAKESGATPEAAALEMVRHIRATGALDAVQALSSAAATVPPLQDAPLDPVQAEAPQPDAGTPEAWAAEHAASSALQAEFGTAEAYIAYRRAKADGRARILGRKD